MRINSPLDMWPLPAELSPSIEFPRDVPLIRAGQPSSWVHFVVRGRVRLLVALPGERDVQLDDLCAGETFGADVAIARCPAWMTALVLDACELRSIAANRFRQLVEADLRVALWTSHALVREARRQAVAVAKFGASAEVRLHLHLAELLALGATKLPDGAMRMTATPNQVEVAQAVGVTREYVSELLSRDEAHGTIQRSSGRLVIPSSSVILRLLEGYRMYDRKHFDVGS